MRLTWGQIEASSRVKPEGIPVLHRTLSLPHPSSALGSLLCALEQYRQGWEAIFRARRRN